MHQGYGLEVILLVHTGGVGFFVALDENLVPGIDKALHVVVEVALHLLPELGVFAQFQQGVVYFAKTGANEPPWGSFFVFIEVYVFMSGFYIYFFVGTILAVPLGHFYPHEPSHQL